MKRLAPPAMIIVALSATAALAETNENCKKSWTEHHVNKDGHLKGTEVTKFLNDMKLKGIDVKMTKRGEVSAVEYNKACLADFWDLRAQEEGH